MPDDSQAPGQASPTLAPPDARLHPRPQLTRPRWTDLGGTWQFAYDDDDRGRAESWATRDDVFPLQIQVPFPPESPASGLGERSFHPVVWYRRTFSAPAPPSPERERLLLHFGAVDHRAEVWVNGRLVVRHEGGHTPFEADITDVLEPVGEQVVVVRAEDQPADLEQPRGKQDFQVEPHNVWYHRTTGIWQPVWLEPVPAVRVRSLRCTTDPERGAVGLRVRLLGARPGMSVVTTLTLRGELLARDTCTLTAAMGTSMMGGEVSREVVLPHVGMHMDRDRWLWSPEHPNLIDVRVAVLDERGDRLDEVDSYVGVRSVQAAGRRFLLNGRPYHLRLVLSQGYWPQSHLAAPDADALRREVELVRELGFNGVRVHQKVEDPRFLYWCDRLGVAVWAELPSAFAWSPTAAARSTREWLEVLERDVSAPSVVAWVPVNESWGVPDLRNDPAQRAFVTALYSLAKALDGSRPVVGNDGWEQVVTDMITVHDYADSGAVLRERYGSPDALERALREVQPYYRPLLMPDFPRGEQPILLTEFGGLSFRAGEDFWNAYGIAHDEADFVQRYRDLLDAVLDSPVLAGFCYTQLTDTEQERNGLLDADRRPKCDPATLREITQRPSAAVAGDAILDQARRSALPPPARLVRQA